MPKSAGVVIRKATHRDVEFILKRWQLIVGDLVSGHAHFRPSRYAPEIARARLLTQLDDEDARVFVAVLGGQRVGFINASVYDRSPLFSAEQIGLIENLYVEPGVRRANVGSALLRDVVAWFRRLQIRAIEAVTAGHNPDATAFFGSHGFDLLSITLLLDLESAEKRLEAAAKRTRIVIAGGTRGKGVVRGKAIQRK